MCICQWVVQIQVVHSLCEGDATYIIPIPDRQPWMEMQEGKVSVGEIGVLH